MEFPLRLNKAFLILVTVKYRVGDGVVFEGEVRTRSRKEPNPVPHLLQYIRFYNY